jgi:uncharacterized protein YbjT (DUF2867 family)
MIPRVNMTPASSPATVVVAGVSGVVGLEVLRALQATPRAMRITTLGRRLVPLVDEARVHQQLVDIFRPDTYQKFLPGHQAAICCLPGAQSADVSDYEFSRSDTGAVLSFANACKQAGVKHFEVLGAVNADEKSRSVPLRLNGELRSALALLQFERLSVFQPSVVLTTKHRFGLRHRLAQAIWPAMSLFLFGRLRKYRAVSADTLAVSMVRNLFVRGPKVELLHWPELVALSMRPSRPATMPISGLRILND